MLYNLNLQAKGAKMGGAALKLALCIAQITSYPLVMAPACETFEILMLSSETNHREAKRRAIRFTLILVTVGMVSSRARLCTVLYVVLQWEWYYCMFASG